MACGYTGTISGIQDTGAEDSNETIANMFVVERQQKTGGKRAQLVKIKFMGTAVATKAFKMGNLTYDLIFAKDNYNPGMYLLLLVPKQRTTKLEALQTFEVQNLVYE